MHVNLDGYIRMPFFSHRHPNPAVSVAKYKPMKCPSLYTTHQLSQDYPTELSHNIKPTTQDATDYIPISLFYYLVL